MPDFNPDCVVQGCERESVDANMYCAKHKKEILGEPATPSAAENDDLTMQYIEAKLREPWRGFTYSEVKFLYNKLRASAAAEDEVIDHETIKALRYSGQAVDRQGEEWTPERVKDYLKWGDGVEKLAMDFTAELAAERLKTSDLSPLHQHDADVIASCMVTVAKVEHDNILGNLSPEALAKHDAEVRKPLVEALRLAEQDLHLAFNTNKDSYGYSQGLQAVVDALAYIKDL